MFYNDGMMWYFLFIHDMIMLELDWLDRIPMDGVLTLVSCVVIK